MFSAVSRFGISGRVHVTALKLVPATVQAQSNATITQKQFREPRTIKPWPYETKKYSWWRSYLDNTDHRFDENTKIIVVEGNIAAGKTTLAKKLAEEFDMMHFPEANFDMVMIDDQGWDIRSISDLVPDSMRPYDIKQFYKNPKHPNCANMQYEMLWIRAEQYLDAMAHLLNTGQGVVLERSAYSDYVFMETMHKFGYISKKAVDTYNEMKANIVKEFYKPHLVIYLDAPVHEIQARIKSRNIPYEVESNVLTKEYLSNIDNLYKQTYLRAIRDESELLIYDWSKFGDTEVVVEDVERIDFEKVLGDVYDPKMSDWKQKDSEDWDLIRHRVTTEKYHALGERCLSVLRYDYPSMLAPSDDIEKYNDMIDKHRPEYSKGYDPKDGLSWLWKTRTNYRKEWSVAKTR